jgi:hypothetical protein
VVSVIRSGIVWDLSFRVFVTARIPRYEFAGGSSSKTGKSQYIEAAAGCSAGTETGINS